ncbi:spermine synthase-like isoform X1 [Leptotrombidium deliense]|uniref:Spermine synthase-like isoform X1 n=1 Tax=Leptotrombidium deliense TaxID=299467 RepID=A0A443S4C7_9ACAR|nr:spermine synthase-like isoform X1 [Leptotrombidium deliense]
MSAFKAFSCLLSVDLSSHNKLSISEAVKRIKENIDLIFQTGSSFSLPTNDGEIHVVVSSKDSVNNSSMTIIINVYKSKSLITINIESCNAFVSNTCDSIENNDHELDDIELINVSNSSTEKLKEKLSEALEIEVEKIPVIKRGSKVPNYFTSSDERVMEYDFDELLFDKRSKYQQVRIYHSKTLGNALFLDGLQNLADSDLAYTHGLMKFGQNSYTGKEILILGGGDGGLLHELLKENPKYVTMVDIDEVVIDACRVHLRKSCGDVLDTLKRDNYEIIVNDCIKYLNQYVEEGRKFDFIFNDLTDIPISPTHTKIGKNLWDFVRNILMLSLNCLKVDGKFLNHAIGSGHTRALQEYEKVLTDLPVKVRFSRHSAFVPSFAEDWVFYEITLVNDSS